MAGRGDGEVRPAKCGGRRSLAGRRAQQPAVPLTGRDGAAAARVSRPAGGPSRFGSPPFQCAHRPPAWRNCLR